MKTNKRTLFLLLLLLLVGAVGYPIIKKNLGGDVTDTASSTPIISEKVTKMLDEISSSDINAETLNNSELSYLIDFSLPLLNIPVGKPNPFAK